MGFEKVRAYIDSLEASYGVPGVDVIVMKDHEVVFRHQAGHRDHDKTVPVDGTELYDIYSATKVITMTAVMQLVEKGILDLEDDVIKYLPAFAGARVFDNYEFKPFPAPMPQREDPTRPVVGPIKLWHLMSMTAGLTYDMGHPLLQEAAKNGVPTVKAMDAIAKMPLLFDPGQHYSYSLGHDVMAAVVEVASGERFADYLDNHIFKPLGITRMTMHPTEEEKAQLAYQWMCDFQTGEVKPAPQGNIYRLSDNYDSGGAGITSDVESYCKVMDALACGGVGLTGERILSQESIRILSTARLNEKQLEEFGRGPMGYSYALGVRTLIHKKIARSAIGEFGWDGAAGAFSLADPENHVSLYYAQQVLGMVKSYFEIHPTLRDLVYEALEG